MRYLFLGPLAMTVVLLQVAASPYFPLRGATANPLLALLMCWAMVRGPRETMVLIPLTAVFKDLITNDPVGVSVLALLPIVPLASVRERHLTQSEFVPTVAVVAAASLSYNIVYMVVLASLGQEVTWLQSPLRVLLPAALLDTVLTPLFYLPLRWATTLTESRARLRVAG
jgi:rod shape-determining protein MreD